MTSTRVAPSAGAHERAVGMRFRVSGRPALRWIIASALGVALALGGGLLILSRARGEHDPDRLWEEGQADFQARRLDRAEAVLQRLARLRAPSVKDSILRAEVAMARGRTQTA